MVAVVPLTIGAITAVSAFASSTRAEYVAQVDPICQKAHLAEKREARRFKRQIRHLIRKGLDLDHPTKAALHALVGFADRAARIARGAFGQIAAVPPAPGDEATVTEWLRLRSKATNYFHRAYHAFARNQKPHQFRRLLGKSDSAGLDADSLVQDWGFEHCA
jgi:hypothetical protein